MASATDKRIAALAAAIAAKIEPPPTIREVVINDGDEIPEEQPDEFLICLVIVTPPERPADAPLPEVAPAVSPRIDHAGKTPIEIQLGYYHERKDEMRDVGLGPDHDWSSHAADAFGLMAISYVEPAAEAAFHRKLVYPKLSIA